MRILAALLTVVLLAPAVLAVKPAKPGPTVEDSLKDLNKHLYPDLNYLDMKCSERLQVSVSDDRKEILLRYLPIDHHGKFVENLPPKYLYRIRVSLFRSVYPEGRWTTWDRVVVRTYRNGVIKLGPIWDCSHKRVNDTPKMRFYDSATLKLQDPNDQDLKVIVKSIKHLVMLLQTEPSATPEPERKEQSDPDKKEAPQVHE